MTVKGNACHALAKIVKLYGGASLTKVRQEEDLFCMVKGQEVLNEENTVREIPSRGASYGTTNVTTELDGPGFKVTVMVRFCMFWLKLFSSIVPKVPPDKVISGTRVLGESTTTLMEEVATVPAAIVVSPAAMSPASKFTVCPLIKLLPLSTVLLFI